MVIAASEPAPAHGSAAVGLGVDHAHLLDTFEIEARLLDATLRWHRHLRPLFGGASGDPQPLWRAYVRLLKLEADVVRYLAPALRAAGQALRHGDGEDRRWSERLLRRAVDAECADPHGCLRDDLRALGAPPELVDGAPHAHAVVHGRFYVADAARHPYAILGATAVHDRLRARIADDLVRGVARCALDGAAHATRYFARGAQARAAQRDADRELEALHHPHQRCQVLEGAYVTSGAYRALTHYLLPA